MLAAEVVADIVPEPAVPLLPGVADEAPDLIEPGGVPGLGDELRARQGWVRLDIPEDRRVRQRAPRAVAGEDRRKVEPEAVDVHLLNPVAQAVHDHAADDRVIPIERIPAPREIGVPRA